MDLIRYLIDLLLHVDDHLSAIIQQYGTATYAILFLVVFCETGLVVTPFLPGDSLLFAAGTFAARGDLDPWMLFVCLTGAAVLGDTVNYWVGSRIGDRARTGEMRWIRKEHIERTHAFFERYGGKTIFLARFVPIVRTFAPFVAGVGRMSYAYFLSYNVVGGVVWVAMFVFAGYYFGNISFVRNNFELVIVAIVVVSVLPGVFEWLRSRRAAAEDRPD